MVQTTPQTDLIDRLQFKLNDEKARVRYLRDRIAFLESRLQQRTEKTVSHYQKLQPYLKSMRDKAFSIFLELPYDVGLLYEEFLIEFEKKYPDLPVKNLPRRLRELAVEGKLWSKQDIDGKARFYLRLKDLKDGENSAANKKEVRS